MSLVDQNTRLLVVGMGRQGQLHAQISKEFGTNVVAGTRPGKGGTEIDGIPIYNTVRDAVRESGANAAVLFVPPAGAADATIEAADAGLELVVNIAEHIPVIDMVRAREAIRDTPTRLIGPNCPGLLAPGPKVRIGIAPPSIFRPGSVGVVSRSGTLTYEAVHQLTELGIGQSLCIGIGGDPIPGTNFIDSLQIFQNDPNTHAVVMIGEIGGTAEEEAAEFVQSQVSKPVIAFIGGRTAPPGKRMGHAGAIISGGKGTAEEKTLALEKAGIPVAVSPGEIGVTLQKAAPDAK